MKTAMAGANHCQPFARAQNGASADALTACPSSLSAKMRFLRRAEGGRGVQERNCSSRCCHVFMLFILNGFRIQAVSDLLQTVSIAPGSRVRRNLKQFANGFERV